MTAAAVLPCVAGGLAMLLAFLLVWGACVLAGDYDRNAAKPE
jgi:hypothetical protein